MTFRQMGVSRTASEIASFKGAASLASSRVFGSFMRTSSGLRRPSYSLRISEAENCVNVVGTQFLAGTVGR